jgi:hypothetical protein
MSEWGQSLTLTKNVNKTSPTILSPNSAYRPHRRHLAALYPEMLYCLHDLCLNAIISRPPSHTMSVPSLLSPPSTPDALLTQIPKHQPQWSQQVTSPGYHSAHSNVSSARRGRKLQLLAFNDHVRSVSTVDVVSFPGDSWLLSRRSDNPS